MTSPLKQGEKMISKEEFDKLAQGTRKEYAAYLNAKGIKAELIEHIVIG